VKRAFERAKNLVPQNPFLGSDVEPIFITVATLMSQQALFALIKDSLEGKIISSAEWLSY
jgi:hypothetical protein